MSKALAEWKKDRELEPDNWVIRKQVWAVEHSERFHDGDVGSAWQKELIQRGTQSHVCIAYSKGSETLEIPALSL